MKLKDVVSQLQVLMPKYSDYFSVSISFTSIVASGGTATVTAAAHGLPNGKPITVSDFAQETPISSVSKDGLVYTFETSQAHDLTYGYPGYETVTLGGFVNPDTAWNASFTLLEVVDRYTFKVRSTESLPTLQGAEYLSEVRVDGINGRYAITLIDDDSFSFYGDFEDGTYISGTVKAAVRISGAISIERAIEQYTPQAFSDITMFVVMNDANVSKNRTAYNDAVATIAGNEDIRMRIIDGFSVFIVKNTTNEIAAQEALDICRHDLLEPICKSLFGARFSTGLANEGDFRAVLTGHNFVEYKKAWVIYQYSFEFTYDLTVDDAVEDLDTRAFNDIDYIHSIGGDDTENMTIDDIEVR